MLFDRLASLCMALAGAMLVVLIFIFGWLVYGRYILNDTPTWVEQVSLLLVVWITFLGAAVGVRRDNHLAVGFIREAMPPTIRAIMLLMSDLMVLAFGIAMAWQGYALVRSGLGRAIPMLGVSEAWRVVALPLSGVLITLFMLARLPGTLRSFRNTV